MMADDSILLIQFFVHKVDSQHFAFGSVWHPLLEQNLTGSDRSRLLSAFESVSQAIGRTFVRVASKESGQPIDFDYTVVRER